MCGCRMDMPRTMSESSDSECSLGSRCDDEHDAAVFQMTRHDANGTRSMRKERVNHARWRCHVLVTFFLALLVVLMATAVTYNPFASEWRQTLAVAKVMAPVGEGNRCASPCRYFTSRYPSPTDVLVLTAFAKLNTGVGPSSCPVVDAVSKNLALVQAERVGAPLVDIYFTCVSQLPFNIIEVFNETAVKALNVHPFMFNSIFHDLRIEPLYLAYVGLPALVANGQGYANALATVLREARTITSAVRFPHASAVDLVEAAAVQLMCTMDVDEATIRAGMGCGGESTITTDTSSMDNAKDRLRFI